MDYQINNHIELRPVKDLLGMNFFIPEYQRGYRWKTRQVKDLLEDIQDFIDKRSEGKYCLQPLVVKKHDVNKDQVCKEIKSALDSLNLDEVKELLQDQWDVVDGQQRLTTIFILLSYLYKKLGRKNVPYRIDYATRKDSKDYLININNDKKRKENAINNIDFFHISNTYDVIENWFSKHDQQEIFLKTILYQTEFIWYESEEKPIEVFTRLNIGKISLTNAELVKALLLNKANYLGGRIPTQNEVAIMWDQIEYTLQDDRFWCFIHDKDYNQPTRIDFLLELIEKLKNNKEENETVFWRVYNKKLGNDSYRTFRYFYQLLVKKDTDQKPFDLVWNEIVKLFSLLKEWYNDNECYHYIGYLTTWNEHAKKPSPIPSLIKKWNELNIKTCFVDYLKTGDKGIQNEIAKVSDLDQQYELEDEVDSDIQEKEEAHKNRKKKFPSKTKCYPLLLLFNIQTIINKNKLFEQNDKFNALSFERFPFDLFKKENGWDIEHIASNTDNTLESLDQKKEWLKQANKSVSEDLKNRIKNYLDNPPKKDNQEIDMEFNNLHNAIEKQESDLNSKDKNKLWNFCLLDQSTNRGYGNSIFATKRKWILNRERGLDIDGIALEEQVFIPLCTLRVFTKFYNQDTTDLSIWNQKDAIAYRKALFETLKENFKTIRCKDLEE